MNEKFAKAKEKVNPEQVKQFAKDVAYHAAVALAAGVVVTAVRSGASLAVDKFFEAKAGLKDIPSA